LIRNPVLSFLVLSGKKDWCPQSCWIIKILVKNNPAKKQIPKAPQNWNS
jgi:hypothetical protein